MKYILGYTLYLLIFLICVYGHASECRKPIVIAIVDTGIGRTKDSYTAHLCKYGHKDFTTDRDFLNTFHTKDPVPYDFEGHGTNIAGIIDGQMAKSGKNYCLVILKVFSKNKNTEYTTTLSAQAFRYAAAIKADVINYSAGGPDYNQEEKDSVLNFIFKGGIFVAAAGNNAENLDMPNHEYFPATYDSRIVSVSNIRANGTLGTLSNYGNRVTRKEIGQDVKAFGLTMSGTSQATAVATGKIASKLKKRCDR